MLNKIAKLKLMFKSKDSEKPKDLIFIGSGLFEEIKNSLLSLIKLLKSHTPNESANCLKLIIENSSLSIVSNPR
jgi:hypothetical protein